MDLTALIIMVSVGAFLILLLFSLLLRWMGREEIRERIVDPEREKLKRAQEKERKEKQKEKKEGKHDESNEDLQTEEVEIEEELIEIDDRPRNDYLKIREHVKKYPICISPKENKHYCFEKNSTIHSYFCYRKGWAYMGQLLSSREILSRHLYYHLIPVGQTDDQITALQEKLDALKKSGKLKNSITFDETDRKDLKRDDFEIIDTLTWFQSFCWIIGPNVYVHQSIRAFFSISPRFRKVHFSLPVQGKEGDPPIFEERNELSMNHLAEKTPYGKRTAQLKDVHGIEFTVEYTISGYCENPWVADNDFNDVFVQNDTIIRNAVVKISSQLSYLPNPKNLSKISDYFEGLILSVRQGKPSAEVTPPPINVSEELLTQDRERLAKEFQEQLLTMVDLPENYTGFVWDLVNVINIYPSGKEAPKVVQFENDLAEALFKMQTDFVALIEETAAEMMKNATHDDNETKRIRREAMEITRKGIAKATEIRIIAAAENAKVAGYIKALKDELGPELAAQVLEYDPKYKAIGKEGTQIFYGTGSADTLGPEINKYITKENQKKQ